MAGFVGLVNGSASHIPLKDGSVQCCVTSPPYYGLRKYDGRQGIEWPAVTYRPMPGLPEMTIPGCDPACKHEWGETQPHTSRHRHTPENTGKQAHYVAGGGVPTSRGNWCQLCGGWRGDLGLEPTPEMYVGHLVLVFREVWRALREDGVLWLNLGDSFSSIGHKKSNSGYGTTGLAGGIAQEHTILRHENNGPGYKHKDLMGIPWRVAFALQADGWYLRSDIIWAKGLSFCPSYSGSVMPESVTDRPTKAAEYIFLLAKQERYYYDAVAVREDFADERMGRDGSRLESVRNVGGRTDGYTKPNSIDPSANGGRNLRSVWAINPRPYPGSHYAVFPPDLIEPMILASTSEYGCCPECGAPWVRVVERGAPSLNSARPQQRRAAEIWERSGLTDEHLQAIRAAGQADAGKAQATMNGFGHNRPETQRLADEAKDKLGGYYREFLYTNGSTAGWRATCSHDAPAAPCIILDPFCGSGTTGLVARKHGRSAVLLDISQPYLSEQARSRLELDKIDAWQAGRGIAADEAPMTDLPLFSALQETT